MQLGPESQRPKKAVATRLNEPTIYLPLTDSEWLQSLKEAAEHEAKLSEERKTKYLRDRQDAYDLEIKPKMEEAIMKSQLENDHSLLQALKDKKLEIDTKYKKHLD